MFALQALHVHRNLPQVLQTRAAPLLLWKVGRAPCLQCVAKAFSHGAWCWGELCAVRGRAWKWATDAQRIAAAPPS